VSVLHLDWLCFYGKRQGLTPLCSSNKVGFIGLILSRDVAGDPIPYSKCDIEYIPFCE
jgi:hypothetical protein